MSVVSEFVTFNVNEQEKVIKSRGLTKEEIDEFRNGDPDGLIFNAFAHENARFQAYNNDYEIMDDQLVIGIIYQFFIPS